MKQRDPIRGNVARILTARELVINRGTNDGVQLAMRFAVLDPRTQDITDPTTGESLGSIALPQVRVEVIRVAERAAIAQTYEVADPGRSALGSVAAFLAGDRPTTYVTLRNSQRGEPLDPKDSYVKVGDPVEEIADDEDDESPELSELPEEG
jgi:hypothetical protein